MSREELYIQEVKPNQDLLVKIGQLLLSLLDGPPGLQPQADQQNLCLPLVGVIVKCPLAWLSAT